MPGLGLEGWGEGLGLSMQSPAPCSPNDTRQKAAGLAERGNRPPMWTDERLYGKAEGQSCGEQHKADLMAQRRTADHLANGKRPQGNARSVTPSPFSPTASPPLPHPAPTEHAPHPPTPSHTHRNARGESDAAGKQKVTDVCQVTADDGVGHVLRQTRQAQLACRTSVGGGARLNQASVGKARSK